ncbi:MAG: hypothetical protein ABSA77_13310 [Thermoguttaceae bacterium]|jgi:hypothetical protein
MITRRQKLGLGIAVALFLLAGRSIPIAAQDFDSGLDRNTRIGPSWANIEWKDKLDNGSIIPDSRQVHIGPFTWGDKFDEGYKPDWRHVDIGTSIPLPLGETGVVANVLGNRHYEDKYNGSKYDPIMQATTIGGSLNVPMGDIHGTSTWVNMYQPDLHSYLPSNKLTDFGAFLGPIHGDRISTETYMGHSYSPLSTETRIGSPFETPKFDFSVHTPPSITNFETHKFDSSLHAPTSIPKFDLPSFHSTLPSISPIPKIEASKFDSPWSTSPSISGFGTHQY